MTSSIPITIAVPVKNEERNLDKCLSRLSRFSHVVVIDSGSTDRTQEIAEAHGAEFITFDWNGQFPKKRNWLLLNHAFETEWVLFLDADEFVDDAFCDAAAEAIDGTENVGFWLHYTNYFLGKPLNHGDAQRKLALLKVGAGLYERIEEDRWSALDMEVHEHPQLEGPVGEIAARIDHNDDRGVQKFITRHMDYALWEASRAEALRNGPADQWPTLTDRQQKKYANIDKWWFAWAYFAISYIAKRGFLDGHAGFSYAFYKLWYFRTIRLLMLENRDRSAYPAKAAATRTPAAASPKAREEQHV